MTEMVSYPRPANCRNKARSDRARAFRVDGLLDAARQSRLTKDTVKLAERERESWLLGRLSKVLLLDDEVAHLEDIVRDEALKRAGTISDLKRGVVGLVSRRGG